MQPGLQLRAILAFLSVLSVPQGQAQTFDCPQLLSSDLGSIDAPSSVGLLADTLRVLSGDATPSVQILEMNVVCLAQGTGRDVYRSVSVIVRYLRDSSEVTAQVEYDCVSAGVWGFASPSLTFTPNATLTTPVRADCSLCLDPVGAPSPVSEAEHCLECNEECSMGLRRCTGLPSSQTCCSAFFVSGACTPSCNSNSQPNSTTFECECDPGYTDAANQEDCDEIDECDSSPCMNGGNCTDLINDFSCACVPGYTGETCTTNIDECDSSPCMNGGNCTDLINDFSCACVPGYTGETCMTTIDGCDSNPCVNRGTCTDLMNDFSCACVPGYTGETCMTTIDGCDSNPCVNRGTCTDLMNDFSCACAPGFGGRICDPCEVEGCKVCPDASVCLECGDNQLTDDNECETSFDPTPIILGVVLGVVLPLLILLIIVIIIIIVVRSKAVRKHANLVEKGAEVVERDAKLVEEGAEMVEKGAEAVEKGAELVEKGAELVKKGAELLD